MTEHVPLSRGKYALVDKEDYERVSKHSWWILDAPTAETDYAVTDMNGKRNVRMHRFILDVLDDPSQEIDHINRNGLDNRKANLRIADKRTQAMNSKIREDNTSGYKGVSQRRSGRWRAYHYIQGRQHTIGTYDTKEEAHHERQKYIASMSA